MPKDYRQSDCIQNDACRKKVTERATEVKAPLWTAATSERTSFDELCDLAQESDAEVNVSYFFRAHDADGDRVECSLVWKARDRDEPVVATSTRLHEPDAKVHAAHALLHKLQLVYDSNTAMCNKLRNLYSIALQRGLSSSRGNLHPFPESTFLEFKGCADERGDWTRSNFTAMFRDEAAKNAVAMWNSFLLYPTDEGRIYFGIHDNRSMHGVKIPCALHDDVTKILDNVRQDIIARFTTQMQSVKVVYHPPSASFIDLANCFSCELIRLREPAVTDAVYLLVLITVKRPASKILMEFDKKTQKRAPENCKPEVIDMTPKDIQISMNMVEP